MPGMVAEPGLRERKKRRTRKLIADVAWRLFVEHGYDGVSVAEIARQADVSEATVFNYFPSKEDLVYGQLAAFEQEVLATVRERPAGRSVVDAFAGAVTQPGGLLVSADPEAMRAIADATRVIEGSRALRARERELWDEYTGSLAALIAEERHLEPTDGEAWVIANALIGVQRALVTEVRRQVLAGATGPQVRRSVQAAGRRAVSALERGLGSDSSLGP